MSSTAGLTPLAWLHSRSYSRTLRSLASGGPDAIELISQHAVALSQFLPLETLSDRRVLSKHIITLEIAKARGPDALDSPETRAELRLVQPLHAFLGAGRQVFEFSDDLVQELSRTDVTEVYPHDIHVPYDAFYLRLPNALPDIAGHAVDGILIQHRDYQDVGRSLVLDFLPPHVSAQDTARALPDMPLAIVPLNTEGTLGAEIDVANWQLASPDYLSEGARGLGIARDGEEWYESAIQMTRRRYEAGARYVQDNLPLIVNALLFIDNCHSEQRSGWSADAPSDLVAKALAGGTGSGKAEQRLVREGWTKVTLCHVERAAVQTTEDPTGRTIRAHWRRGHWRRQPTGPGRSRVTLIRVRPTMVGTGPAPEGRTYRAKATGTKVTAASLPSSDRRRVTNS